MSYNYLTLILKKKLDLCLWPCIVDGVIPVLSQSYRYRLRSRMSTVSISTACALHSEDPLGLADISDDSATDRVTPRMASLEVEKRDAQHT